MDMGKLILAFAPVFAAGFAVQQLLEILTSFFDLDSKKVFQNYKKPILGAVAFGLGCALASQLNIGVLHILKGGDPNGLVSRTDFLATALIISAGTEGINSILKFLKYSKEDKKLDAAASDPKSAATGAPAPDAVAATPMSRGVRPTEDALTRINRQ